MKNDTANSANGDANEHTTDHTKDDMSDHTNEGTNDATNDDMFAYTFAVTDNSANDQTRTTTRTMSRVSASTSIAGGLREAPEPRPERPLRVGFGARDGPTALRAVSGSETYSKCTFWRRFGSLLQTSENTRLKRTLTSAPSGG